MDPRQVCWLWGEELGFGRDFCSTPSIFSIKQAARIGCLELVGGWETELTRELLKDNQAVSVQVPAEALPSASQQAQGWGFTEEDAGEGKKRRDESAAPQDLDR